MGMGKFLDNEVTDHEITILAKVIEEIVKHGKDVPTTNDILHELIRLSEISLKHFFNEIN